MKIQRLIASYAERPPADVQGIAVIGIRNFATETFHDVEGDPLPKEKMLMIDLADGRRVAVRPSGTEPKIKFYMFARREPHRGQRFSEAEIVTIQHAVKESLQALWAWIQRDVEMRLAS